MKRFFSNKRLLCLTVGLGLSSVAWLSGAYCPAHQTDVPGSLCLGGVVQLCRFITLRTPHTRRHVLYEQHLDRTQVATVLSLCDGCKVQGLVWHFLLTAQYPNWHYRQRRNLPDGAEALRWRSISTQEPHTSLKANICLVGPDSATFIWLEKWIRGRLQNKTDSNIEQTALKTISGSSPVSHRNPRLQWAQNGLLLLLQPIRLKVQCVLRCSLRF